MDTKVILVLLFFLSTARANIQMGMSITVENVYGGYAVEVKDKERQVGGSKPRQGSVGCY